MKRRILSIYGRRMYQLFLCAGFLVFSIDSIAQDISITSYSINEGEAIDVEENGVSIINVCTGDTISIQSTVIANLSYEWRISSNTFGPFNPFTSANNCSSSCYLGEDSPMLTISNIQTSLDGRYYQVFAGEAGTQLSASTNRIQIKVNSGSSGTIGINASDEDICTGEEVTLEAQGVSSEIEWFTTMNTAAPFDEGATIKVVPASTTSYFFRALDGCSDETIESESKEISVSPGPKAEFQTFPSVLCTGSAGVFLANTTGNSTDAIYEWTFPGGNPNSQTEAGPIEVTFASAAESRSIQLDVTQDGCTATTKDFLTVVDQPTLTIGSNAERKGNIFTITENMPLELSFSSDLTETTFELSCQLKTGKLDNIPASISGPTFTRAWSIEDEKGASMECEVIATNTQAEDCSGSTTFSILVRKLLSIPDVLTPNGDMINEKWAIDFFGSESSRQDYEIKLYDRLGNCVKGCDQRFTIDEAIEWNAEDCPGGPNWYIITGPNGFEKTGVLTIIKN